MAILKIKKNLVHLCFLLSFFIFFSCENLLLGPEPKNTAEDNFETLWKDFNNYYALFDVMKVNWDSLYTIYRPQVNNSMSENELWNIFEKLLSPLQDSHICLTNKDNSRHYNPKNLKYKCDFSIEVILNNYLKNVYLKTGEDNIIYGKIPGHNLGYIYISTFIGKNVNWSKNIDDAIQYLRKSEGIIIDVRNNFGGYFENANNIASCFFNNNVDFLKETFRNGPKHNDFEPFHYFTLELRKGCPHFKNKTVVLTNSVSASATDRFVWLFKNYRTNNICIGDTTEGCFAQAFQYRALPNGWIYSFSASLITSMNGIALDSIGGTPPDLTILNNYKDLQLGIDSVMENAIKYLEK